MLCRDFGYVLQEGLGTGFIVDPALLGQGLAWMIFDISSNQRHSVILLASTSHPSKSNHLWLWLMKYLLRSCAVILSQKSEKNSKKYRKSFG